jgi:hypothetical protein
MALAYIKANKSSIGGYFFDVNYKEDYTFENVITSHPTQTGSNVNDHVYSQPNKITFDVGVSDCLGSLADGQFSEFGAKRSAAAFNLLLKWRSNFTLLTIASMIGGKRFAFSNMLIQSLAVTKDKSVMNNSVKATITMQQIIVTNAIVSGVTDATTSTNNSGSSSDSQKTDTTSSGSKSKYWIKDSGLLTTDKTKEQSYKDILNNSGFLSTGGG